MPSKKTAPEIGTTVAPADLAQLERAIRKRYGDKAPRKKAEFIREAVMLAARLELGELLPGDVPAEPIGREEVRQMIREEIASVMFRGLVQPEKIAEKESAE